MKIAIHQPNFLPWMGYFYKIALCDIFVFYDDAEYTQKSFIRRVLIHKEDRSEEMFITVPLRKHSSFSKISDLKIIEGNEWRERIIAQVHQAYHKSAYYYQIEPLIYRFFEQPLHHTDLSSFNIVMIKYVSDLLDITPKWMMSSEMNIETSKNQAVIDVIKLVEGTQYISGNGARKYHIPSLFSDAEIELLYPDFPSRFDASQFPSDYKYKSILSLLANHKIEEIKNWLPS